MAIKDIEAIKKIIEAARKQPPVIDDPKFFTLREAKISEPVMAYTPEGKPAFWIVPFLVKDFACGFARVELSGKISKVGIFGSTSKDSSSWINASFFKNPPPEIIAEIQAKFAGLTIQSLFFRMMPVMIDGHGGLRLKMKSSISSLLLQAAGMRFNQGRSLWNVEGGFMKKIKYEEWAVHPEIVEMLKVPKVATAIWKKMTTQH